MRIRSTHLAAAVTAGALLLGGIPASGVAGAGEPPPAFEAEYVVKYGRMTLGEGRFELDYPETDRYTYRLEIEPRGLARMFLRGGVTEESTGRVVDGRLQPERYTYERTGSRERTNTVTFDHDAGRATFNGGSRIDLEEGEVFDRLVPQVLLMTDLAGLDGDEITYRVADDEELRDYTMRRSSADPVEVEAGRFDVTEVERVRSGSDRTTRIWVAPELQYLPVKGEHESGGRTLTLELRRLEGPLAP